ncbi:hypothetical protein EPYR_03108 [Erwinia pyrifoliae DSM 12163]|nr:hypothetical protein EPYR_03108 [Erwinia pyrifoliae DSM 12163]
MHAARQGSIRMQQTAIFTIDSLPGDIVCRGVLLSDPHLRQRDADVDQLGIRHQYFPLLEAAS